jgi:hypothetical protein
MSAVEIGEVPKKGSQFFRLRLSGNHLFLFHRLNLQIYSFVENIFIFPFLCLAATSAERFTLLPPVFDIKKHILVMKQLSFEIFSRIHII